MFSRKCRVLVLGLLLASVASVAFGYDGAVHPFNPNADAPPIMRSGNPADDNGNTCVACHRGAPVNSGQGRLVIRAARYRPGVKQVIEVDIRDAAASKWGFQLVARLASDPARQAGTFTADADTRVRCGPLGATYTPCNGEQEYASHSLAATEAGTRGGKTFRIEWTAPATDVGEVVFYAAGNATNNNSANTGDFVYTATHRITGSACSLTSVPVVSPAGVGNAADLRTVIGPNALISIFGSGFAEAGTRRAVTTNDLLGGMVPNELECTAVEIDGRRAPLIYVDAGQINAQVPTATREGPVQVRVIVNPGWPNEIRGNAVNVRSAEHAPAFFTFNGRSIVALNASANYGILAEAGVVAGGAPAKPGDVVVLYGTGFGVTDPVYQAGEFASAPLRDAITVTVGGTRLAAADVLYAGQSPEAPGVHQFNVRVPASAADGDVGVTIAIGSVSTQAGATIPVRR